MGSVGLLYVGAVLFLNGMMLLGYVNAQIGGAAQRLRRRDAGGHADLAHLHLARRP